MRSSGNEIGRFNIPYEIRDIKVGITQDLTTFVGTTCSWWVYLSSTTDAIYDVNGRTWALPVPIAVTRNILSRGTNEDRGVGFYNVDALHLTVNASDILPFLPDILKFPDYHSKDRVVYDGQVYRPTAVQPRGIVGMDYSILSIQLVELHNEELVNDVQFLAYAS